MGSIWLMNMCLSVYLSQLTNTFYPFGSSEKHYQFAVVHVDGYKICIGTNANSSVFPLILTLDYLSRCHYKTDSCTCQCILITILCMSGKLPTETSLQRSSFISIKLLPLCLKIGSRPTPLMCMPSSNRFLTASI